MCQLPRPCPGQSKEFVPYVRLCARTKTPCLAGPPYKLEDKFFSDYPYMEAGRYINDELQNTCPFVDRISSEEQTRTLKKKLSELREMPESRNTELVTNPEKYWAFITAD